MPCSEHVREALAELMHDLWANWTHHFLIGTEIDQMKWKLQASLPFDKLNNTDKEKDRREADKIIAVLDRFGILREESQLLKTLDHSLWDGKL